MDRFEQTLNNLRQEIIPFSQERKQVQKRPMLKEYFKAPAVQVSLVFLTIFLLMWFLKPSLVIKDKNNKKKSVSFIKLTLYSLLFIMPYIVWHMYCKK